MLIYQTTSNNGYISGLRYSEEKTKNQILSGSDDITKNTFSIRQLKGNDIDYLHSNISPSMNQTLINLQENKSAYENKETSWYDAPKEWPAECYSTNGGPVKGVGDGYFLSSAEKEMLTKATGYHFDERGAPCDENGEPVNCPANDFFGQLSLERRVGVLSGPVTVDYMKDLYQRLTSHGLRFDSEWFDKSIEYIKQRRD